MFPNRSHPCLERKKLKPNIVFGFKSQEWILSWKMPWVKNRKPQHVGQVSPIYNGKFIVETEDGIGLGKEMLFRCYLVDVTHYILFKDGKEEKHILEVWSRLNRLV